MHRRLLSSLAPSGRARLWLIVAVVAAPAALLAGWLIVDSFHNERRAMERHLLETVRAVSLQVEAELREGKAVLQGLATSTPLAEGDLATFRDRAHRLMRQDDQWVILADSTGRELVNTKLPPDASLPAVPMTTALASALAAGESYDSDLVTAATEPKHSVLVAVPTSIGGGRPGILCLAITPTRLSNLLRRNRIASEEVLAIRDRNWVVLARSRGEETYVGRTATTNVQRASRHTAEGVMDSTTLDGQPSIAAFRVLSNGWTVVIGGHKARLFEQATGRTTVVVIVAVLVGVLALGLALWVSRMTERVAQSVLTDTQALARGERVEPRHTGIREADMVSRALAQTSRELAERAEALARARDEALAASRAKDEFLAALSHELRTPLSPVLLLASDAARDPAQPPAVRELLATIEKNVLQEVHLIDDLLDVTRIAAGKISLELKPVELDAVVCEAVESLRAAVADKRLDFRVRPGTGRTRVRGDAARLLQVFTNVIGNAIKFTPEDGIVMVVTRLDVAGRTAWVEVSDSGIGMSAEEVARVFEKFAQGDHALDGRHSRFGGLGLGLAISRSLVAMHGGTIEAESAGCGKGATFRIKLPLEVGD